MRAWLMQGAARQRHNGMHPTDFKDDAMPLKIVLTRNTYSALAAAAALALGLAWGAPAQAFDRGAQADAASLAAGTAVVASNRHDYRDRRDRQSAQERAQRRQWERDSREARNRRRHDDRYEERHGYSRRYGRGAGYQQLKPRQSDR